MQPYKSSKPMSIVALVCGVVGIISLFVTLPAVCNSSDLDSAAASIVIFPAIGLISSILGIIFGAIGMKQAKLNGESKGLAVAGLVCGIVGCVFSGIATICSISVCAAASSEAARYSSYNW